MSQATHRTVQSDLLDDDAHNVLPTATKWKTINEIARTAAKSTIYANVKNPEDAAVIILKGEELGIGAMHALEHINVVEGKPCCSAELQLALLIRGGVEVTVEKDGTDLDSAVFVFKRPGVFKGDVRGTMTKADALRIQKRQKGGGNVPMWNSFNWKQYPANMLRARAISNGARVIGPDLLGGMSYTPEELGATVDEEGRPLDDVSKLTAADAVTGEEAPKDEALVGSEEEEQKTPGEKREVDVPWVRFRKKCGEIKTAIGKVAYYTVLEQFEVESAADVEKDDVDTMKVIVNALAAEQRRIDAAKSTSDDAETVEVDGETVDTETGEVLADSDTDDDKALEDVDDAEEVAFAQKSQVDEAVKNFSKAELIEVMPSLEEVLDITTEEITELRASLNVPIVLDKASKAVLINYYEKLRELGNAQLDLMAATS